MRYAIFPEPLPFVAVIAVVVVVVVAVAAAEVAEERVEEEDEGEFEEIGSSKKMNSFPSRTISQSFKTKYSPKLFFDWRQRETVG